MNVSYGKIKIRDAELKDARTLLLWWNNGKVMEHAGFPYGLETTEEKIKFLEMENAILKKVMALRQKSGEPKNIL